MKKTEQENELPDGHNKEITTDDAMNFAGILPF